MAFIFPDEIYGIHIGNLLKSPLSVAIPNFLPEFIKAAVTQQWIDTSTGKCTNHEVAERMLSLLSLESNESVKHAPWTFKKRSSSQYFKGPQGLFSRPFHGPLQAVRVSATPSENRYLNSKDFLFDISLSTIIFLVWVIKDEQLCIVCS